MVNVNGSIIGLTRYPTRFVGNFRKLRRAGRFSEFVSVYINHHHKTVHIACDGGRICRPMIIVEEGMSRVVSDHIVVSSGQGCLIVVELTNLLCSTLKEAQ